MEAVTGRLALAAAAVAAAFAAGHRLGRPAGRVPVRAPWEPPRAYGVLWYQRRGRRWHADPATGGGLETALWCAARMRAAGFSRVAVVEMYGVPR